MLSIGATKEYKNNWKENGTQRQNKLEWLNALEKIYLWEIFYLKTNYLWEIFHLKTNYNPYLIVLYSLLYFLNIEIPQKYELLMKASTFSNVFN